MFQTIGSPGGAVCGLPECGDALAALKSTKPVMSYTSTMAASAAFYLGCGASYFYASKSATTGSIGHHLHAHGRQRRPGEDGPEDPTSSRPPAAT